MFEECEIITLLIALGIGFFLLMSKRPLEHIYNWKLLSIGYLCLLGGSFFTVLEGIVWESGCNILEHTLNLLFSILFFLWCWQVGFHRENKSS